MKRVLSKHALLATLVVSLVPVSGASALSLVEAYGAALQNDRIFRSAGFERDAGLQSRAIGASSLLPNISMSLSKSKNNTDRVTTTAFGAVPDHPKYTSTSNSISLRQSLFNLDGVARYYQGVAQSDYSEALFNGRAQELLVRVVGAYSDVQFAETQVRQVTAQRDAFAEQKTANERMLLKGEGTRTDVLETKARFELSEAQLLEARDNLFVKRNELSVIVGQDVTQTDSLSDNFPILPMLPATFEEWKALTLEKNADIVAQRFAVESARQEVNKSRAGHTPRLDMIASYSNTDGESLNTYNQEAKSRSIGVQLSIPIYSGGYVNAVSNQAVANYERAKSDLDNKIDKALVELRKQYNLVLSGEARMAALNKSVESGRLLITATKQSVKGGVRINYDVLNAVQQLYGTERDLAQARYNYLLSYLRLRFQAGTLGQDDLNNIAGYFVPAN